jgi:hypothetical protein
MALTVNLKTFSVSGSVMEAYARLTLDNSYTYGGETFDVEKTLGIHSLQSVLFDQKAGSQQYQFVYDATNKKIKVMTEAPPVVFGEVQTIATNQITLDYPPAYIMSISKAADPYYLTTTANSAGTATVLLTDECAPTAKFAIGQRASFRFEAAATGDVYITYITQAWKEVWDALVQEEAVTVTANVGTPANQAIAIQAICATGTTSFNVAAMNDKDDAPGTLECAIDMTTTTKTLTFFATDAVTTCAVTYIKLPASGFLYNRRIAEESLTAASNICTTAYPILIWGYSGQIPEIATATRRFVSLAGALGAGEASLDLMYHTTRINTQAMTTGTAMYVWGRWWEIPTIPLEVKNGVDLSDVIIGATFIGT